jgi:hypothetical protein
MGFQAKEEVKLERMCLQTQETTQCISNYFITIKFIQYKIGILWITFVTQKIE